MNMVKYPVVRWLAAFQEDGAVRVNRAVDQQISEYIEIASDWSNGEEAYLKGKNHFGTGFLGRGSTKYAIYVCFKLSKILH